MNTQSPMPAARRVTREELYRLVWEKPMSRLAEEFGITGNGLAKVCDRLDVPYPARGHWAKIAAGKPVVTFKLAAAKSGTPESADIFPTPAKPAPSAEMERTAKAAEAKVQTVLVPEITDKLHPRVNAWMSEHKAAQRERQAEARRNGRDSWWARALIGDLTERDLYRFRVSSAIFTAVERAGGKIEASPFNGRCVFLIDGHKVECSIVEKLMKSLKPREQVKTWTAYPDHHQSGLASSGHLRVSITTYLEGRQPQWIETDAKKIGDLIPAIVGTIMSAGPILEKMKIEREDSARRYREEEARRQEARRLKEVDDKRWGRFQTYAANWELRLKLLQFIAELEKRAAEEENALLGDLTLTDWLTWAREHAENLDPLSKGAKGLFEAISKTTQWS